MPKAVWNGVVLAESDNTVMVEGNYYFPAESLNREYFEESNTHTFCPWKGVASYLNVKANGQVNKDAAWYYPKPKPAAEKIAGCYAFWRGVRVQS